MPTRYVRENRKIFCPADSGKAVRRHTPSNSLVSYRSGAGLQDNADRIFRGRTAAFAVGRTNLFLVEPSTIRVKYNMTKKDAPKERECPDCAGTGFQKVKQPEQPGRRIYPPRCSRCGGKGRIAEDDE